MVVSSMVRMKMMMLLGINRVDRPDHDDSLLFALVAAAVVVAVVVVVEKMSGLLRPWWMPFVGCGCRRRHRHRTWSFSIFRE